MKNTFVSILVILSFLCISFKGDNSDRANLKVIVKIKQEGFNNSKVMENLFNLTDVNGPRLTGSTGMKNAEKWAAKQLKEWGLENVKVEPWGSFGKGWETKKCYLAMTAPYYQQLIAAPKAWTPGTNGLVKANAVLVRVDSVQDLAKYRGKLNGKIVVLTQSVLNDARINFNADAKRLTDDDLKKIFLDPHLDELVANANPPRRNVNTILLRQQMDSFLMAEGVLAALSGGRGTVGTVFTSNGASHAWNAKPVLPELEMGAEHYFRLIRLLEAGKDVSLEVEIQNNFLFNDSMEYNVVGEIHGTDLANEVVMLGAHMDSWHAGTGTTDNGTGSAVVMETVRILKAIGIKPRRTIRVVLWSGEEQGILGSRAYVKKHFGDKQTMQVKPAYYNISAYYNLDNGGGKIRGIYMQSNDALRPIFEAWLAPFEDLGANTITNRNTGSTDHIAFDEIGIPAFQFIQDPLEYGSRSHHTNMDTYERVNPNDLMQASVIMASFVYHTAMRDEQLPRKPMPKPVQQKNKK
jgi:hypothetical protein